MTQPQPDPRPRPQYGEYASAEEQRARMAPPAGARPPEPAAPAAPGPVVPTTTGPRTRAHPVGRVVTIALLAYGAVNVLLTAFSFMDLASLMPQAYQMLGVPGEFTNEAGAHTWGTVAAIVLVVGYVITAVFAVRAMRRGRHSWWIPLVGAVITYIGVYSCIAIVLTGDSAFAQFVQS